MTNANEMFDMLSAYLSKGDVYAAKAIAKVSAFILKYRQDANMTQKEFAKKMGVTQAMVSKWESAEYNFTIDTIARICEKLDTAFDIEFKSESEYMASSLSNDYENVSSDYIWSSDENSKGNPFFAA
ncbi:MAG: helix-turn-helix transcriptional regulator [Clostridia bacterium]|nr:helix-turn-helix transcriptional regulator [Clostridia bacterium]